ncbi:MAG: HNH endonuclease [Myxococcales bacterium]|nr:HNH endonuclease [Myxococcales bacterium]
MPCSPAKARRLLRTGKAKVLRRTPFTLKLLKVEHDKVLQVHHKVFRSQGGTETPDNLVTLCRRCHEDLHAGMFVLKARKSKTKQATEVGMVKAQLKKRWEFEETYGYETKWKREQCLGLPKSHANDAVAICSEDGETVRLNDVLYLKRHVAAGDYQQTKGARSEKRIPTGKLFGLRKHDLVRTEKGTGFVKGKRSTGFFALESIEGETLTASANVKKATTRLTARSTTLIQRKDGASSPL